MQEKKNKLEISPDYFFEKEKINYEVGDLVEYSSPFFAESRLGLVIKIEKNPQEVFRETILEIYCFSVGNIEWGVLPLIDEVKQLSKSKKRIKD